jgi:hydroxyacylglutathione hydrolase
VTLHTPLQVEVFTSAGWGQNAYIVRALSGNGMVAIDPGGEAEAMAHAITASATALNAILLTHAHVDHIEGVAALVRATRAPVYLHPADRVFYDRAQDQAAAFGVSIETPPPPDRPIVAGQALTFGDISLDVRYVPGHSPGHVMFYSQEAGIAFVGDVIFMGSIGRTDLPGGDYRQLMMSIRNEVLTLPQDAVLYSGHGPATTIGQERVGNPFIAPVFGGGGLA